MYYTHSKTYQKKCITTTIAHECGIFAGSLGDKIDKTTGMPKREALFCMTARRQKNFGIRFGLGLCENCYNQYPEFTSVNEKSL